MFASPSKPGYGPPLGPGVFAELRLPTCALGGIDVTKAAACLEAGPAGVAVMGTVMRSPDPAATVAALLSEIGT
ncbi:MAG: thiamine phosphate synthase [Actinomycetota bacterium]|nr:thiamine phosphate synthase [Actinomycetota bacterium]